MTDNEKIRAAQLEYRRDWNKKNKEHVYEYNKQWRADNKDKIMASSRKYWLKKFTESEI